MFSTDPTDGRRCASWRHHEPNALRTPIMFFFFSNKLGWLGSIAVSIVLSVLVYLLFKLF